MKRHSARVPGLVLVSVLMVFGRAASSFPQGPPSVDRRLTQVCDLNKVYAFSGYRTREEWLERADYLRSQILASAGLLPMPPKSPLNPRVFGRTERDGYTVEKVYFESHPGFLVTGNLYRPRNRSGPFPAIVSPHGHWTYGRLEDTDICSGPGRAINFARQGYVVFTYDMVGYGDSTQLTHSFGGHREELWGISLAGLQLWDSIRAVDFLCSLPEVDQERIAATGESGGGTQTFLLMAVDPRIKVGAPVNMVSAHMQGGCLCENAPGLRIDTFNVELAALAAPRPLLLVSATGDWTKDTLKVEYPAIKSIYKLFDAEDRVNAVQMNAPHNYNKESREAVYKWFGRWLLKDVDDSQLKEKRFKAESLTDLLVFYGIEHPKNLVDADRLTNYLIADAQRQLDTIKPDGGDGWLKEFKMRMGSALEHSLAAKLPAGADVEVSNARSFKGPGFTGERFFIGRKNEGDRVPAVLWIPSPRSRELVATLVVNEEGSQALAGSSKDSPGEFVGALLKSGQLVLSIDCFQTGEARGNRAPDVKYFTTYNRTDLANRVQDILTAVAYLRNREDVARADLVGQERAGLWCLLARGLAPEIGRTAVDVAQFDNTSDEAFLKELFSPGLRRAGDLRAAVALAAPSRLLIHNTGGRFRTEWMDNAYKSLGRGNAFRLSTEKLKDAQIVEWLK
ncbi:MAG TPA: acetylxylan esterase [Blastocatellia bacterium]|nr:acetylxylan esterase [Blastocatellia bacterium]